MSRQPATPEQKALKAAYDKEYRAKNKARLKAFSAEYYKQNRDTIKAKVKARPRNKEYDRAHGKKWRSENKSKLAFYTQKYNASKMQRTPKWLTKHQLDHIQAHYDLAWTLTHEFGIKMEVDHIVPLQGKDVSGLHVPWNLQIMSKSANASKSNRVAA